MATDEINVQPVYPHEVEMTQYVIYDKASDYPGQFVLRRWFILTGNRVFAEVTCQTAPSLDGARALVPPHAICVGRHGADDPAIAEVWI